MNLRNFALMSLAAVVAILLFTAYDNRHRSYNRAPVFQTVQPVYVPNAPAVYPPPAVVVQPTPMYYAPPPVTVRTYAPTVVRTPGTQTVITREGAPVRATAPTPATSAPSTTVYGSKTPATNAPFAGGGSLSDRQGQVTGFRANTAPSMAPASRTSVTTSSGSGLFGTRPSTPTLNAPSSGGSLFGGSRPAPSLAAPRPSGGSLFGGSRSSTSVGRR